MAQINLRTADAATYVGFETVFASTPPMIRAFPVQDSVDLQLEQNELNNEEESVDLYDNEATVRGLKNGMAKMLFYVKVPPAQLVSGQSSQAHYLNEVLRASLGFRLVAQGSNVVGTGGPSTFTVTTGHGVRFLKGSWLAVEVNGEMEPAKVINAVGDTLTVYPQLSSTVVNGARVVNSYTYLPSVNAATSLHIQHAKNGPSSEGLQWVMSGSAVNLTFDIKRNELAKIGIEAEVASWQGPGFFNIATGSAQDTMSAPFAVRDAVTIFQPVSTTTRNSYCLMSAEVKINGGLNHIECWGATEGKIGTFRTGQRIFGDIELKFRFDPDVDSIYWESQQLMHCSIMIPKGTGNTKRWFVLEISSCRVVGKPVVSDENGMFYMTVNLQPTRDATIINPANVNLETTPFRVALL
jgi:hypothetical protein